MLVEKTFFLTFKIFSKVMKNAIFRAFCQFLRDLNGLYKRRNKKNAKCFTLSLKNIFSVKNTIFHVFCVGKYLTFSKTGRFQFSPKLWKHTAELYFKVTNYWSKPVTVWAPKWSLFVPKNRQKMQKNTKKQDILCEKQVFFHNL